MKKKDTGTDGVLNRIESKWNGFSFHFTEFYWVFTEFYWACLVSIAIKFVLPLEVVLKDFAINRNWFDRVFLNDIAELMSFDFFFRRMLRFLRRPSIVEPSSFVCFFLVWEWTSFFFIIEFPFIAVHWILEVQSFVLFFYCFWFYRARYQFYWVFTELLINELGFFSRHYSDLWTNLIGFHGWLQILLGFTGFYLVSNRSGQAHPRFSWLRFIHLCGRLTKWWSGCKFWFYRVFLPSLPSFIVFFSVALGFT